MRRLLPLLAILIALLSACGESGDDARESAEPTATRQAAALLTPAPEARPIVFPEDEAPHDSMTEWWYFTGHMFAPDGARYGFEFVIFQVIRGNIPTYYASHFAITDNAAGRFSYGERFGFEGNRQPGEGFHLGLDGWEMQGHDGEYRLRATLADYAIELQVTATGAPAVHNQGSGYMDIGMAGGSYYYSRPHMELSGTLTVDGAPLAVEGDAWMDHQWGNFVLVGGGGWDWFALSLDDGTALMVFELRGVEGIGDPPDFGTLVRPDGEVVHLPEGSYTIAPRDTWTSPATGATYPVAWTVTVPGEELALEIAATMPDQELDTTASTGTIYWEGEVVIDGTSGGAAIGGLGYVELTGYAGDVFNP